LPHDLDYSSLCDPEGMELRMLSKVRTSPKLKLAAVWTAAEKALARDPLSV